MTNTDTQPTDTLTFTVGDFIDERYRITKPAKQGGMSMVYEASDIISNATVGIKVGLPGADLQRGRLAFDRERKALADLPHANIVKLLDYGLTGHIEYLVLEWLGGGALSERIASGAKMSWGDFYEQVGRPILDALRFSHQRKWCHRDLKPHNILFTDAGCPKIIDFGISRDVDSPRYGATLLEAGSPPYTPPERNDGYLQERRDIYSWAAIAVSCLAGRVFTDMPSLLEAFSKLKEGAVPKSVLERALHSDRDKRHESISVLLAETDEFHLNAVSRSTARLNVYVRLGSDALGGLRETFSAITDGAAMQLIEDDVNASWSAHYDADMQTLELFGATLRLSCIIDDSRITAQAIKVHAPDSMVKWREVEPTVPGVVFSLKNPEDWNGARANVATALHRLRIARDISSNRAEEKRKNRWFDCWGEFLREKERVYRSRQIQFRASNIKAGEGQFVATIEQDFEPEELGESLIIQSASAKPIIFSVNGAQADQIFLTLRSGRIQDIPSGASILETNFEAERKSLQKQRIALEEIRAGRAVNPRLKGVLSEPASVAPATDSGVDQPGDLSEDKILVLGKALDVQDLLAVKGPPGTGKTTLIAALIASYLKRYPERRILLSSQTHVALDHVILKLQESGLSEHVVRVVSNSQENSQKVSKSVGHLTLEAKARDWCVKAEERSEAFVDEHARELGVDAHELKVAILGKGLLAATKAMGVARAQVESLKAEEKRIDESRKNRLESGPPPDQENILLETQEAVEGRELLLERIASLEAQAARLNESLDRLGNFGNLFTQSAEDAVVELLAVLDTDDTRFRELRPIIQLHLDWLNRLGTERSFYGAVLAEARVVAGTCIGLASIPALYQDSYDLCIIDEASKATATEALVPMARSRATVLVGDPEQLPPFFEAGHKGSKDNFTDEAKESLLSIMLRELPDQNKANLVEQRRMTKSIGDLVSEVFYGRELVSIREDDERAPSIVRIYPHAVTWISTTGKGFRERITLGKSYRNPGEVDLIIGELKRLVGATRRGSKSFRVAVIAAYAAQVAKLRDEIRHKVVLHDNITIEVQTVDAFQGREADVCFYSVTRSNDAEQLGFQREKKRLNVALSRARDALVIVGDDKFCREVRGKNPFSNVLTYIENNPDFCTVRKV